MPIKNPPFETTQSMLTDVAEISEMVGRLSAGKLSSSPVLRRMLSVHNASELWTLSFYIFNLSDFRM